MSCEGIMYSHRGRSGDEDAEGRKAILCCSIVIVDDQVHLLGSMIQNVASKAGESGHCLNSIVPLPCCHDASGTKHQSDVLLLPYTRA